MRFITSLAQVLTVSVLVTVSGAAIAQQAYPAKPIRLILPFVPGGNSDVLTRLLGQKLTESWGQQVILDNRPGADGIIGTEALLKSPPDGYTIMQTSIVAHVIVPLLAATPVSYDPIKDFIPVCTLASTAHVLVAHPSVPANNLQELIALAKSKPGQLNYSAGTRGSISYLVSEMLSSMAGIKLTLIFYKGGGAAFNALLGGHVQLSVLSPVVVMPYLKSGKLRAIATSSGTRLSVLPDLPTFAETGLPGFDAKTWFLVLAPAGAPKPIVDKLSAEIAKIMAMPDLKDRLVSQAIDPFAFPPEQTAKMMKEEFAKYAKVVKDANIKPER